MNDGRHRSVRINRRVALSRIGAGALTFLAFDRARAADANPNLSCVATPEQTEGPFFVDERLNRADIRSDPGKGRMSEGVPLKLRLIAHAIEGSACTPLRDAIIDIWHCDARGAYSDVEDASGQKFLRGYQTTGSDGVVEFVTIYPGWYRGRATHIHFKVRGRSASNRGYEFASQLYFDEALSDRIYSHAPYARSGRRTHNDEDFIYRAGGKALTLALAPDGDGYTGRFDVGLRVA